MFALDFKFELSEATLAATIGRDAVSALLCAFGHPAHYVHRITIRRVEAHNDCINFHLDHSVRSVRRCRCPPLQPSPGACDSDMCPPPRHQRRRALARTHHRVVTGPPRVRVSRTMQIPLNNEGDYEGGHVVYALLQAGSGSPRLHAMRRQPGSVTIHDKTVPHGVTALRSGLRCSLFLQQLPPPVVG